MRSLAAPVEAIAWGSCLATRGKLGDDMERIAVATLGERFKDLIFGWKRTGIVFQDKGAPF